MTQSGVAENIFLSNSIIFKNVGGGGLKPPLPPPPSAGPVPPTKHKNQHMGFAKSDSNVQIYEILSDEVLKLSTAHYSKIK